MGHIFRSWMIFPVETIVSRRNMKPRISTSIIYSDFWPGTASMSPAFDTCSGLMSSSLSRTFPQETKNFLRILSSIFIFFLSSLVRNDLSSWIFDITMRQMHNITREDFNFCWLLCHLWSLLSFSLVQGSSKSHSFPQKLNQVIFCLCTS